MLSNAQLNENTVAEMLYRRATDLPHCLSYRFPETGQAYTWRRTHDEVRVVAEGLIRLNLKKGSHIALLMDGCMEFILCTFAAASIGAITVPINTFSKKEEIKHLLQEARPNVLIIGSSGRNRHFPGMIQEIMTEARQTDISWLPADVFILGDDDDAYPFRKFTDLQNRQYAVSDADFTAICASTFTDDPVVLIYTSGTTGLPKGVLRSAASFLMVANNGQQKAGKLRRYVNKLTDRLMNRFKLLDLLPLYHLGGLSTLFTTLKTSNFSAVMLSHFNPVTAINVIDKEKCQIVGGTPYMIQSLMNVIPTSSDKLKIIKGVSFSSAAVSETMINKVIACCKNLTFFTVSYGSSEAGLVASGACILKNNRNTLISILLKAVKRVGLLSGSIGFEEFSKNQYSIGGRINKNVQVKIADIETGEFLPASKHGEIVIKSHRVMRYTDDTSVKESTLKNGWFRSGDIGYLDESGLLIISGRIKRIISRGGEKISPVEVENALLRHAAITDAFVLGIPDQLYGEQVCAAIIVNNGASNINIALLKEQFLSGLSSFKIPRYFVLLQELPLSSTGKIAVSEITKLALQKINDGDFYA